MKLNNRANYPIELSDKRSISKSTSILDGSNNPTPPNNTLLLRVGGKIKQEWVLPTVLNKSYQKEGMMQDNSKASYGLFA